MPPIPSRTLVPSSTFVLKLTMTLASILASALIAQAAWAQAGVLGDEPDHFGHPTEIIGISPARLLPSVLIVPPGSAFGWLNYSAYEAAIEFDLDISSKLTCRSPGAFRSTSGNPASPRVGSGAFVTLCNLAPGVYDYRVVLGGDRDPLLGKIVIEQPG